MHWTIFFTIFFLNDNEQLIHEISRSTPLPKKYENIQIGTINSSETTTSMFIDDTHLSPRRDCEVNLLLKSLFKDRDIFYPSLLFSKSTGQDRITVTQENHCHYN